MLDLIVGTDGKVDVNTIQRPRTRKWYGIDLLFETMARCGDHSAFTMDMAYTRGGTALHIAAMHGQTHLVEWLLAHGAKKSLSIKNTMGATPLDMAWIFGPHPEVESLLSAAMLETNFASKYKVRKGSLHAIRGVGLGCAPAEEEGKGAAAAVPAAAEGAAAAEDRGAEADEVAATGQTGSVDERPTHSGVSGGLERSGDGTGAGVIASGGLSAQLRALQQEQEAAHGKLDAVLRHYASLGGKLGADEQHPEVLAWIAAEEAARVQNGGV